MNTTYYRDHDGWNGKTIIDLDDGRQLVIRTSKRGMGGGLVTTATAWSCAEDGSRRHIMGFGLGSGDYSERLMLTQPGRITEKQVRHQHDATMNRIEQIRADVKAYYDSQARSVVN